MNYEINKITINLVNHVIRGYDKITNYCMLQGYLAHNRPPPPVGPYSRPMPRTLWRS